MTQPMKRRRYPLVNKSHQYRFLAMVLIYNLIIVALLVIFLFTPDIIQLQDENLSIEVRARAADKILTLHSRIWPAALALICVFGLHSFRIFHRFIGPLYRFTMAFEQVQNGDLSFRITLRKKDYLREEEKALNNMLEVLDKRIGNTQLAVQGALESLGKLEKIATREKIFKETDKGPLSLLRQHLDVMADTVQYFRISKGETG